MPYVFSGPAGGVFVVDVSNPTGPGAYNTTIQLFDRTGRFVRAIGRSGQGPGEYSGIVSDVKDLPDGRVLVLARGGLLVYSSTGRPITQWATGASSTQLFVDPAGFVHLHGVSPGRGRPPTYYMETFTFDGRLTDRPTSPQAAFPTPPMVAGATVPFVSEYLVKWSPLGYFVTVNTADYAIDLRLPRSTGQVPRSGALWAEGDPVRSIRRTVPLVPVGAAERADWRQSITMFRRRQVANWVWDGPEIPTVKPAISGLQIATDGRIWVRVSQRAILNPSVIIRTSPGLEDFVDIEAERRWVESHVYDVFAPSGDYVGQVRFPVGTRPPHVPRFDFAIDGDVVWGVKYDSAHVPSIQRYRVSWGG
jgi:hypothetical protein